MSSRLDPYALVGTTVRERFSVDSFVSVGRFSAVYRGTELDSLRPVALRLLKVRSNLSPSARTVVVERLRGLARPMSDIAQSCPTFADVIEVGALITAQGRWLPLLVQTWLEGKSLEAMLAEERATFASPRTLGRAMEMLAPVADALAYAHARSAVHGSLAPRNLFLRDGVMSVLDLGMAQALHAIQTKDRAFQEAPAPLWCFAPSHGAPEQFNPDMGNIGPGTDVFALALVLTELVTGEAPLGEGDDSALERAAIDTFVRPTPRAMGRDLGDHVESVFERALAVRTSDRYSTVASFWDALRTAARVMGRSSSPPPRLSSPPSSRRSAPPPLPDSSSAVSAHAPTVYALHEMLPPRPVAPSIHDAPTPRGSIPAMTEEEARALASMSPPPVDSSENVDDEDLEERVAIPPPPKMLASSSAPHAISIAPPPGESRRRWTGALSLAAAFAVGAGLMAIAEHFNPRIGPPTAQLAPQAVTLGAAPRATCPEGMVEIGGGHFFMGSDDDLLQEKPAHPVTLSRYCIDVSEVTVAQYKRCSDGGECKRAAAANEWPEIGARDRKAFDPLCNARDPDKRGQHPINCVDWEMAATYCAARGARLPTEAEWEFAARGADGRRFPWGDQEPTGKHLNACGRECVAWGRAHGVREEAMYDEDDGWPTTSPVGSFPMGDSPFGLHDVVGNVWEWTADWYDDYHADASSNDPRGPANGDERVIRGGAWNGSYADWVRPTFRWKNVPRARSYGIGFRCAKTFGG